MLFAYKLSGETSPHSICLCNWGEADPPWKPNLRTVQSQPNQGLRFHSSRRREGSLGGRGYISDEHGFRNRNAALHAPKSLTDGHTGQVKAPPPTPVTKAIFCSGYICMSSGGNTEIPLHKLTGGQWWWVEAQDAPAQRGVIPVSRAKQQGCPAAWLKCSCAAAQAALVTTEVCLTKENDTLS